MGPRVLVALALVASALVLSACAGETRTRQPTVGREAARVSAPRSTSTMTPSTPLDYTIVVDEDVSALVVTACAPAALPTTLVPGTRRAAPYVASAWHVHEGGERALVVDDGRIEVGEGQSGCVRYRVDALRAAWHESTPTVADRVGRDLVLCPDLFLWRAPRAPVETSVARFVTPEGVRVLAPWARDERGYVVTPSTYRLYGRVVVGRGFTPVEVELEDARFDVAVLPGPLAPDEGVVRDFLALAGRAVAEAWGRFPRARVQVTLTPVPARDVPFGMVVRGGGPGVHLLVGALGDARTLASSWVTVHELAHLLTPTIDPDDAWLGEGIATWYQGVLRARAGLVDEDTMWRSLLDGLARGARAEDGHTLSESSKRMRDERNYTRVYWGGTAFALLADVALRTRASHSLDDALEALDGCCLESERMHTARELIGEMERALGVDFLLPLHDEVTTTRTFPDTRAALAAFGVSEVDGEIVYARDDEHRALREALVRPRVGERSPRP